MAKYRLFFTLFKAWDEDNRADQTFGRELHIGIKPTQENTSGPIGHIIFSTTGRQTVTTAVTTPLLLQTSSFQCRHPGHVTVWYRPVFLIFRDNCDLNVVSSPAHALSRCILAKQGERGGLFLPGSVQICKRNTQSSPSRPMR